MILENIISVTAENYAEEQHLLSKFPNSFWVLKEGNEFHTFLINAKKQARVIQVVTEWESENVRNRKSSA